MTERYKLSSLDLFGHFLENSGQALNLTEIGIQDQVSQMVKTPNMLGKQNGHSLQGDFIEQILQGKKSFKNTYPMQPWWQYTNNPIWAIGGAVISGNFNGGVINQDENYFLKGEIHYEFYDYFTDPYDTPNIISEDINAFGKPFNIKGSWVEYIHHPITFEQYERLK